MLKRNISAQSLLTLQVALEHEGISTTNARTNTTFGDVSLLDHPQWCLRVDAQGEVSLYNVTQGAAVSRVLMPILRVNLSTHRWHAQVAEALREVLAAGLPDEVPCDSPQQHLHSSNVIQGPWSGATSPSPTRVPRDYIDPKDLTEANGWFLMKHDRGEIPHEIVITRDAECRYRTGPRAGEPVTRNNGRLRLGKQKVEIHERRALLLTFVGPPPADKARFALIRPGRPVSADNLEWRVSAEKVPSDEILNCIRLWGAGMTPQQIQQETGIEARKLDGMLRGHQFRAPQERRDGPYKPGGDKRHLYVPAAGYAYIPLYMTDRDVHEKARMAAIQSRLASGLGMDNIISEILSRMALEGTLSRDLEPLAGCCPSGS